MQQLLHATAPLEAYSVFSVTLPELLVAHFMVMVPCRGVPPQVLPPLKTHVLLVEFQSLMVPSEFTSSVANDLTIVCVTWPPT